MKKFLFAALVAATGLSFGPVDAARAQQQVRVCLQSGNQCLPISGSNPFPISGSFSASVVGFRPVSAGTPIAVTTGGVTGTLPTNTGAVVATNVGTTNGAYCSLGGSTSTSAQYIAPNGGWFAFAISGDTQLTCITSTSTTTVNMVGGSGLPTGTGGGGGGSGSSGAVFGPTAVGQAAANPPVLAGGTSDGTATGTVGVLKIVSGIGSVNTAQVNGVTTLAGAGAVGTGSQRVAVGADATVLAGSALGLTSGAPLFTQITAGAAAMGSITNTGFSALQGGAANSITNPFFQAGAAPASTTMQNGATANSNGTILTVSGYAVALVNVNCSVSCSGGTTINFEGTDSTGTFFSVAAYPMGGGASSTTATTTGQFLVPVVGLTSLRARISAYSAGTITATGTAFYGTFPAVSTSTGGTSSNFGSSFPSAGTAIGLTNGTNMVAWSATSNFGTSPSAIAVPSVNAAVTSVPSGAVASGAYASGSLAAGAGTDGWNVTEGAKADSVCGTATGTCSITALIKYLNSQVVAAVPAGTNVIGKVGVDQTTFGTTNGVVNAANTYNTVAASATAQALTGGGGGASGDYLSHCVATPGTTSPGVVTILDNATSIVAFAGGASSVSNLVPFSLPIGAKSTSGAWKVTTGANVTVVCVGKFT